MLRPDPNVRVLHMRLTDKRFPGWSFELRREPHLFFAIATKASTVVTTTGYVLAADALDAARARVHRSQAARLGVDLEAL